MDAITNAPIARERVQGVISRILQKNYASDGVYQIYVEQNDTFDSLYEKAWETGNVTPDDLSSLFYEQFLDEWYLDAQFEIVKGIGDEIHDALMDIAVEENLPAGDVETQWQQEMDNINDEFVFDYSDVTQHIQADFNFWLSHVNSLLESADESVVNAVVKAFSTLEAQEIGELVPVDKFKDWFTQDFLWGEPDNARSYIESISPETDLPDDDTALTELALKINEKASAEDIIENYDDFVQDDYIERIDGNMVAVFN